MQLNASRAGLRAQLAAATVALLGVAPMPARATEGTSSALLYAEPNRVTAFETRVDFKKELLKERVLHMNFTLDALTGASPNGALPSRLPQTFTGPSSSSAYRVAPGAVPLDESFKDTRYAAGASVDLPAGRLTTTTLGLNLSTERDYFSGGASASVAHDFFSRNTTLSLGVSGSLDVVRALGGTPDRFALVPAPAPAAASGASGGGVGSLLEDGEGEGEGEVPKGNESKRVGDVLVGITQVLNRSTLMQLNYSVSRSSGYLTDPYKIMTVALGGDSPLAGDPVNYRHESRPDTRLKQAAYWEGKHTFGRDVLDVSYRYMWDDWGIRSQTTEGRYLLQVGERNGFEPQLRFYRQTAADFFAYSLIDGDPLPTFASSDTRLGKFDAWTGALKYTRRLEAGGDLGFRVGYYVQTGDSHPADAIGSQRQQDLFPKVTAVMSQVSYSFRF